MLVKQTQKNPRPGDGTPGQGRPRGVPNKTTALLKDVVLKAAEVAGGGGLVLWDSLPSPRTALVISDPF